MAFQIVSDKNSTLAYKLAYNFNKNVLETNFTVFADGEHLVQISLPGLVVNKTILLLQQFCFDSAQSINNQVFKLLLLCDLLKKLKATKIIAVLPYLPYSRQDKSDYGNFNGAISLLGKLLKAAGIDEVLSFELHNSKIISDFAVKLTEIKLENFLIDFLRKSGNEIFKESGNDFCIIAPDQGALARVQNIAKKLNNPFARIEKKRVAADATIVIDLFGDVADKNAIIIDDIIDSGKTAFNACELLKQKGAKKVIGFFIHGILSDGTLEKLEKSAFDRIYLTDTIQLSDAVIKNKKIEVVSINVVLRDFILKHYFGELT